MSDRENTIYILYGSQTGNSQDIAEELASRCIEELKINVYCGTLNSIKNEIPQLKNLVKLLFIVCSTTGNGDAPDNANKFWSIIKNRSLPKDFFENLSFSVLGLGDTNYDKFCYIGKSIDKRITELGGKQCLNLHCADEAVGLEMIVDAWLNNAFELIRLVESK